MGPAALKNLQCPQFTIQSPKVPPVSTGYDPKATAPPRHRPLQGTSPLRHQPLQGTSPTEAPAAGKEGTCNDFSSGELKKQLQTFIGKWLLPIRRPLVATSTSAFLSSFLALTSYISFPWCYNKQISEGGGYLLLFGRVS